MTSSTTERDAVAYINGNVYTVNTAAPWAEAFIVSAEGIFTHVGSNSTILGESLKRNIVTYDLRNRFILPGIHDAHIHLLYTGLASLGEIQLPPVVPPLELSGHLSAGACACTYKNVYGSWLLANGFAVPEFDRAAIDFDFPSTPVYIRGGACHNAYANTAALEQAGYDVDAEPDSHAARVVRRNGGKDGTTALTGELSELGMTKLALALPKPPLSHVKRALQHAISALHAAGVTSFQEASANSLFLEAMRELELEGKLKMECFAHIVDTPAWLAMEPEDELGRLIERSKEYEGKHLHTGFVKFIMDGVPLEPLLTHCGLDENGQPEKEKLFVKEGFLDRVLHYDRQGKTVKAHCTGHGSVRAVLDTIEEVRKRQPNGPRHEIAHCDFIHPDDYARFKSLNVTAEMSPAFLFRHPIALASDLMEWDFKTLIEHDAHLTMGSDAADANDLSILPHCASIVSTIGSGSDERGGEIICRMLTLQGAEAVGREQDLGSIEVGKKANFISVSRNLAKGEFADARVLGTWFEGEKVFGEC